MKPVVAALALFAPACDAPQSLLVVANDYAPSATDPYVVYAAHWQAVTIETDAAIPPGASSSAEDTVPASANTAYVVLAPGWKPGSGATPTSLVVLQSRSGFAVALGDTLQIPVDDTTFIGNCASGSFLTQAQADFITQFVFPDVFQGLAYHAATCTTTPLADADAP